MSRITFISRASAFMCAMALVPAGLAQASVLKGTVVHHNARARSFVIADAAGHLFAVHAARQPRLGTRLSVSVRRLPNGTYALRRAHISARGLARSVRCRGVVSWVDPRRGVFALSAPGVSMLVRESRRGARAADAMPSVGEIVTATGTLSPRGDLAVSTLQSDGSETSGIDLEAVVLAVDQTAGTITVSADDQEDGSGSLVVTVPSSLSISLFAVGEEVELNVAVQPDGSYLLLGSASDEGVQGADDQGEDQGDQPGVQGDQGDPGDQGLAGAAGSQGDQGGAGVDSGNQGEQSGGSSGD
jgi:hypothetical protein